MSRRKRKEPLVSDAVLDEMLRGQDPREAFESGELLKELQEALAARVLQTEMEAHLERPEELEAGNHRNGHSSKQVLTGSGSIELRVPRDRLGHFEPQLVEKYARRLPGFDEKVISLYARGLSTREISSHVEELYGVKVSRDLVSRVTETVREEVLEWQQRPLERVYAIVYMDAVFVKVRDGGLVQNKAVYLAIGVTCEGRKEILGMWIEENEGARFWLSVMNELKGRGVEDILIAVVDGLKGFPEAIEAAFPRTLVQTCIVHLLRYALAFASYKERKDLARALKRIYKAASAQEAERQLGLFEQGRWGRKYPAIAKSWRANWDRIIPFFAFSAPIRKIIYTTNAIESLNSTVRRAVRARGHFPSDRAATKLIYLALMRVQRKWRGSPATWRLARNEFAIHFGDRFPAVGR